MEKVMEEIIEVILADVSCEHQVDSDGAGRKYDSVIYTLNNEQEVIKTAIKMLNKIIF